jgi:hypothetical protein
MEFRPRSRALYWPACLMLEVFLLLVAGYVFFAGRPRNAAIRTEIG